METVSPNNMAMQNELLEITALSATALLVNFGKTIDTATNEKVMSLFNVLQQKQLPWIVDLIPAYCSLCIVYNMHFIKINYKPSGLVFDWVKNETITFLTQQNTSENTLKRNIEIPVCFEGFLPNDLQTISNRSGLAIDEIIAIFLDRIYHVYMLGFLPGFAYMGEVDNRIAMARKDSAMPINAGAVGITGVQAGIYPVDSPGGWHILGHTPLLIFNENNNPPNILRTGDKISFKNITKEMYFNIKTAQKI